jgi:hypothetical protein
MDPPGGLTPNQPLGVDPQILQVRELLSNNGNRRDIDVLLIQVGGNDVGFGPLLKECAAKGATGDQCSKVAQMREKLGAKLGALPDEYKALNDEITQHLSLSERGRIYIGGYPDPTGDENGNFCSEFRFPAVKGLRELIGIPGWVPASIDVLFDGVIKQEDIVWMHDNFLVPLNGVIKEAADDYNWVYAGGWADLTRNHGYCVGDGKGRKFNQYRQSFATQGDEYGTMHPNHLGTLNLTSMLWLAIEPNL